MSPPSHRVDISYVLGSAAGSVILKIAYGDKVQREHGVELVKLNAEAVSYTMWCSVQIWLVNMFPMGLLSHVRL